jgi:hypothetical protein
VERRLICDLGLVAIKTASEPEVVVFAVGLAFGLGLPLGEGRVSAFVLGAFWDVVFAVGLSLGLGLPLGEGRASALVLAAFWAVVFGVGLILGLGLPLGAERASVLMLEVLVAVFGEGTGVEEPIVSSGRGFTLMANGSDCWGLQPVAKSSSTVISQ